MRSRRRARRNSACPVRGAALPAIIPVPAQHPGGHAGRSRRTKRPSMGRHDDMSSWGGKWPRAPRLPDITGHSRGPRQAARRARRRRNVGACGRLGKRCDRRAVLPGRITETAAMPCPGHPAAPPGQRPPLAGKRRRPKNPCRDAALLSVGTSQPLGRTAGAAVDNAPAARCYGPVGRVAADTTCLLVDEAAARCRRAAVFSVPVFCAAERYRCVIRFSAPRGGQEYC